MHRTKQLTLVLVLAALMPSLVYAHGLGASFEQQSGEYLIDVGYEPEFPEAERQARFDFELWRFEEEQVAYSDRTPIPYSHVWVRILKERMTIFASGIHRQDIGPTTLLYMFPSEGEYTLIVSYRGEGGEVASAEFAITVNPADQSFIQGDDILPALVGAVLGLALVGIYVSIRRRHKMLIE